MAFTTKIQEVKVAEKRYYDVTCDGCNIPLEQIGPEEEEGGWRCLQADDALILNLEGGYAMAIDPIDASKDDLTTIFCGECTRKLCEQWPAISKIVRKNCSFSLGHECSKERKFVWKSLTDCCYSYCVKCGRSGTLYMGLENPEDRYSHPIIDCLTGCKNIGPAIWSWEVKTFVWRIYSWSEEDKVSKCIAEYYDKEVAEKSLPRIATPEQIEEHIVWVEKAAILSTSK